ncbi:LysR family transcriptional regulator [Hydrogenophaga palleronii]|uniref:LysR family transcriptional regulator n=1 Tax=Hydrogenophaga palleronii TaxID=65655 RepID=UPI0008248AAC|nr:LysR family transcriptional regulator [Hydrogenophaga palleronii]
MKTTYDRLELLDTFLRISEARSLSKAARQMGSTQPTVSRRLVELESLLGSKLVNRTTSTFSLTDEGQTLLVEARELGERWAGLSDRLKGRQSRPEGTLRVIGPVGYGASFLTDALTKLMAEHPRLRVELELAEGYADLAASGAECCVFVGRVPDQDIVCRTLGTVARVLVATPELLERIGPVTLARLPRLPFVGLDAHVVGTVQLVRRDGTTRLVTLNTPFRTPSLPASYRATLNGAGIGSAAPWMCRDDLASGRLVRVLPQWSLAPVGIHVALLPGRHRPARVTAFIEAMREQLTLHHGFVPSA